MKRMKLEELAERTRAQMPTRRWEHTQGVRQSAAVLAKRFGGDAERADLAALLHDYCKYWPIEKQIAEYRAYRLPEDALDYDPQLLHGPLAAEIAFAELGVDDKEVLDAIRYHTSGRVNMTLLDKIVCLADYIEPGRDFPEVGRMREISGSHLDEALLTGLDSTIQFLLSKGKKIYPQTLYARNGLIDEMKTKRMDRSGLDEQNPGSRNEYGRPGGRG